MNPSVHNPQRQGDWLTPGRFAFLLSLLIVVSFPDVLLFARSFVFRDFGIFGHPLAFHHRQSFWRGEIPLWNPLSDCGQPFLAQWNTLVLYPFSLIYLLLPMPWSLNFFCLAHLLLAGVGMFVLARRWTGSPLAAALAGTAFSFNGLLLNSLMWPNNIAALGWMPWVILLVEKAWSQGGRTLIFAALAGAIQMLAGAPEVTLFTWLLAVAFCLGTFKSPNWQSASLRRFVAVIAIVAALAAAQLLPFLDLLGHSQRGENFRDADWAMPPWGWLNYFVPLFRCHRGAQGVFFQSTQLWTSSYYVGIVVVLLAVLALLFVRERKIWILGAITFFGLLMALGENTFLFSAILKIFPPLGFMRFPIKFVVLPTFALPLLTAFGFARAAEFFQSNPRRFAMLLGGAVLGMGLVIVATLVFARTHPFAGESWSDVFPNGSVRLLILLAAAGALGIWVGSSRLLFGIALALSMWIDLRTQAPLQNPTVDAKLLQEGWATAQFQHPPRRGTARLFVSLPTYQVFYQRMLPDAVADYAGRRLSQVANLNLLDDLPKLDGFYSLYLKDEREVWEKIFYAPTNNFPSGLADFLGVAFVSDVSDGKLNWRPRDNYLPLITGGQKAVIASPKETLAALALPDFDPRKTVFLPEKSAIASRESTSVKINSPHFSAHRIEFEAEANQPAMLVVAQTFYGPWQAFVDGKPATIWRANYAFQALEMPAGKHRIELVYRDRKFFAGAVISGGTLLGCLAAIVIWRRRPGTESTVTPRPA